MIAPAERLTGVFVYKIYFHAGFQFFFPKKKTLRLPRITVLNEKKKT